MINSAVFVFNTIANVLKEIITGFLEFFNTIPEIFNTLGEWATQLFPQDFATYIVALVPIIITLIVIKFARG